MGRSLNKKLLFVEFVRIVEFVEFVNNDPNDPNDTNDPNDNNDTNEQGRIYHETYGCTNPVEGIQRGRR